jgi:tetratricopeptide (TPR) repeat protein
MKILVSGTCQAALVHRAIVAAGAICGTGIDCRVVGNRSYRPETVTAASDELIDFVKSCDIFIQQIDHRRSESFDGIVPNAALKVTLPVVGMNWLWPFATQAHPENRFHPPYLPWGAFPAEHGDALLNRLLRDYQDPDAALAAFGHLDPAAHTDLDRLFELTRARVLSIEEETDLRLWHTIEDNFRRKRLFWDKGHPSWELLGPVCREILRRLPLDLDASRLDAIIGRIGATRPFARMQAPIHPRVAEHFALAWHRPGMRYQQGVAGWFTHAEHVRRYARFDVDLEAYRAVRMTDAGDALPLAERLLRGAMARAPDNHELDYALAANLWKQKRPVEALAHAVRAAHDLNTATDGRVHRLRCAIAWHLGWHEEAVLAAQDAIRFAPYPAPHYHSLGRSLGRLGRDEEALAALRRAVAADGYVAAYHLDLGHQLEHMDRSEEAAAAFADAVACDGKSPACLAAAARQFLVVGRVEPAFDYARRWSAAQPGDAAAHELAVMLLQRLASSGEAVQPATAYRAI